MKKILLSMLMLLTISSCGKANESKEDKKDYVIVELGGGFKEGGRNFVKIADYVGYKTVNEKVELNYYTKKECSKIISEIWKNSEGNPELDIGDNYVIDYRADEVSIYYCIDKKIWEQIKPDKFIIDFDKKNNNYIRGEEILYKDLGDFSEKMKSCGVVEFDYQHLPIPETPLICDKYSEKNPIPVIALKDIWEIKKESFQNKRDFNEVLKEFLKNKK